MISPKPDRKSFLLRGVITHYPMSDAHLQKQLLHDAEEWSSNPHLTELFDGILNRSFFLNEINDNLNELLVTYFGGGEIIEVIDEMCIEDWIVFNCRNNQDHYVQKKVENVFWSMNPDTPKDSKRYVLIDKEYKKCMYVVAIPADFGLIKSVHDAPNAQYTLKV